MDCPFDKLLRSFFILFSFTSEPETSLFRPNVRAMLGDAWVVIPGPGCGHLHVCCGPVVPLPRWACAHPEAGCAGGGPPSGDVCCHWTLLTAISHFLPGTLNGKLF